MKSKMFPEITRTMQTSCGRWLRIFPDQDAGYCLHDLGDDKVVGRILVDVQDNWIYDGDHLTLNEQEEAAGEIIGYQKEMSDLLKTINFGE